jgi:hypothetical protein
MDLSIIQDQDLDRVEHYMVYKDPAWPVVETEKDLLDLPSHIRYEVDQNFRKQTQTPEYITDLRKLITPCLETFQGQTFLDWSYSNGFLVTELLHPLEQAHRAAADLWRDRYQQLLQI